MSKDIISICNEQKIIFIKKILLITQQMLEVCDSGQIDNFNKLLQERADYMHRIEKCDALLQKPLTENSEADENNHSQDFNADKQTSQDQSCQIEFFQSVLRKVLELNEQIEHCLQDKRKELIATSNQNKPLKGLLHQ